MSARSYFDLKVWQKAMDVTYKTYKLIEMLLAVEKYALADQMRRSSVSVPSNIAEGQRRSSQAETVHYCAIAQGPVAELETQLLIVNKVYGIDTASLLAECEQISKMLSGLTRALKPEPGA